jgi:hypothetical protein
MTDTDAVILSRTPGERASRNDLSLVRLAAAALKAGQVLIRNHVTTTAHSMGGTPLLRPRKCSTRSRRHRVRMRFW